MADPFTGEIRIFPYNFAPRGWAFCDGRVLPISQNTPLFSILGTTYGGDGLHTFALPDIRGRAVMGTGQGTGLSPHSLGERGGTDSVSLTASQLPPHSHSMHVSPFRASLTSPDPHVTLAQSVGGEAWQDTTDSNLVPMAAQAVHPTEPGDQPHNNLMPFLTLNFHIALQGVFPPRP